MSQINFCGVVFISKKVLNYGNSCIFTYVYVSKFIDTHFVALGVTEREKLIFCAVVSTLG